MTRVPPSVRTRQNLRPIMLEHVEDGVSKPSEEAAADSALDHWEAQWCRGNGVESDIHSA